jgi:hypothetical protein
VTDADAQSLVDVISQAYDCTISTPSRLVFDEISHGELEEPVVTNTFFLSADGNECDEAMVALDDLGKEKGIEFSRLVLIPFEYGDKGESEPSNMDLIHEIDPK